MFNLLLKKGFQVVFVFKALNGLAQWFTVILAHDPKDKFDVSLVAGLGPKLVKIANLLFKHLIFTLWNFLREKND